MKLKFKNLVVATAAIFTLTACTNSENLPVRTAEEADINLTVKIPQTRGVVEEGVKGDMDIKVSSLVARVKSADGKKTVGQTILNKEFESDYKAVIKNVLVDGTENVEVILNGIDGKYNVDVKDVQPKDGKEGLASAIYFGKKENLGNKVEGKYNVSVDAKSLVARIELAGASQFNKRLVESMDLSFVSPVDYTLVYGYSGLQTKAEGANLALTLEQEHLSDMNKGHVVANHLFDGDKTRMTVGFKIVKYAPLTKENTGEYIVLPKDGKNYYIYKLTDNTYAADMSLSTSEKITDEWTPKFVAVTYDKNLLSVGDEVEGGVDKIAKEESEEFFTLTNFAVKDGTAHEKYLGGNIYNIDLIKGLKWNADGTGHENEYSPDLNNGTDGKDDNNGKESAIVDVTVTITPWVYNETSASIS